MSSIVLDQTQDLAGREIYRITQLYPVPEYVKQASDVKLCGTADQEPHLFADQTGRNFPCHTKAATWLSMAFFLEKAASLPEHTREHVQRRLTAVAEHFGIGADLATLRTAVEKQAATGQQELTNDDFAFVWKDETGATERRLPMRGALEVKAAADWFQQYRDEFLFGDRQRIADKILTKQAQYGAGLPEETLMVLEQAAGRGICSAETAASLIESRVPIVRLKEAELAAELQNTVDAIRSATFVVRTPERLQKIAAIVDQVDRKFGLVPAYGDGLDRPEDVLFAITQKAAAAALRDHVPLTSGTAYKRADLERVRAIDIQDYMGTELAEALSSDGIHLDVTKAAAVLPTLPRPDAELFDQIAREQQIQPIFKAAGDRVGLTREDLFALALAGA